LCAPILARAATIEAKVAEVQSGNTLVVMNINRPLRIRLNGVAPPESGQPFSDVAREHLSALVLNKTVTIDYSGMAADSYLVARVSSGGVDIGAQMIRDGVAWYDGANAAELSSGFRDVYVQCEQAARSERRGLWQDPSPVSPWEFRKAQAAKASVTPSAVTGTSGATASASPTPYPSLRTPRGGPSRGTAAGLSSDDLFGAMVGPGSLAGNPSLKPISPHGARGQWIQFESPDNFSIQFPSDGFAGNYPVLDSQGKMAEINTLIGGDEKAVYLLMRIKGSNDNATDAAAADTVIQSLIGGMNRAVEQTGQADRVTAKAIRDVKLGDYNGKQYGLIKGPLTGTVRVLSRQSGDQRELFMLCMLNLPDGKSSGVSFFNSFKIGP
jgi:endonuclease YncB( thermonuclease family)